MAETPEFGLSSSHLQGDADEPTEAALLVINLEGVPDSRRSLTARAGGLISQRLALRRSGGRRPAEKAARPSAVSRRRDQPSEPPSREEPADPVDPQDSSRRPDNLEPEGSDRPTLPGEGAGPDASRSPLAGESVLPISIYLSDEHIHENVEAAVDAWLAQAGLTVEERDGPVIGSWFRKMRAGVGHAMHSPAAAEAALTAVHAADSRLLLAQDAMVTATLLQNLGPVIASLQPTKDAVLRVGALLIVKVDWAVQVFQLTAAQQAVLDHKPHLASSPLEIIAALQLSGPNDSGVMPIAE